MPLWTFFMYLHVGVRKESKENQGIEGVFAFLHVILIRA